MKILIIGKWGSKIHESTLSNAFENLGHDVIKFRWGKYFSHKNKLIDIFYKLQLKINFGPLINNINNKIVKVSERTIPDIIFFYRPSIINKETLIRLKNKNIKVAIYNNDNAFSEHYPKFYWYKFKSLITVADIIFAYRPSDISNFKLYGAKNIHLLPPWYDSKSNYVAPLKANEDNRFRNDVVFVGHFENDGRLKIFEEVVKQNINLKIFGPEWNKQIKTSKVLNHLLPITYLYGEEYNKAFTGSKIAIVLYSKLNKDVYTRKCFEIPVTKTFMIAKRTLEMENIFEEGKDIVFFDNTQELIEKIKYYLKNNQERLAIAQSAYNKIINGNYEVIDRAKFIIEVFKRIKNVE